MRYIFIALLISTLGLEAKDYRSNMQVKEMIALLQREDGLDKERIERLFAHVEVQTSALKAFLPRKKQKRTPAQQKRLNILYPKYGAWDRYIRYKLTPHRISQGVAFIKKHEKIFEKVQRRFGVPMEIVTAIIGIETVYGGNVGKYPIFDTLSTLAFEPNRRNRFFRKQLLHFIRLAFSEKFNPKNVYGSYAGAIGLGQFMPSNYKAYGIDFDQDGFIRLQQAPDAIASIAFYLKKHHWHKNEPIATRVSYEGMRFRAYKTGYKKAYNREDLKGIEPKEPFAYHGKVRLIKLNRKHYDELWYATHNFRVLTRYNHSAYYAMAVYQLAQAISKAKTKEEE